MGCGQSSDEIVADKHAKTDKQIADAENTNKAVDEILNKVWTQFDKDGNGWLDFEELKEYTKETIK